MVLVDHCVPNSMKLFRAVVGREREVVAAAISCRVVVIDSAEAVQWLMDVTKVVDQETQSVGFPSLLIVLHIVHDSLVHKAVLVAGVAHQPVNDSWNGDADVLFVELEIGIVIRVATLVKVWNIDEVPVGLPSTAFILNHVCEGSGLNEPVILLATGDVLPSHHL